MKKMMDQLRKLIESNVALPPVDCGTKHGCMKDT